MGSMVTVCPLRVAGARTVRVALTIAMDRDPRAPEPPAQALEFRLYDKATALTSLGLNKHDGRHSFMTMDDQSQAR